MTSAPHERFKTSLAGLSDVLSATDPDAFEAFLRVLGDRPRVFVTGAGRSGFAVRSFVIVFLHRNQ